MRLADLAGQTRAIATLTRALDAGRVPHAYLFDGPAGVGKRTAALGLGMALVCSAAPRVGCGRCDACQRVAHGNHPDVRVIAPETTQIIIDQMRDVVLLAATRPHEAPARVVVLDQADCLNVAAANALLKTLEEPAPDNHIVLVTAAPDRLLPTIRSRTQRVRFIPVPTAELVEEAVRRKVDRVRAETAAAVAGGSVARLLELCEGEADAGLWEAVEALRSATTARDVGTIFTTAAALGDKESKAGLPETLRLLAGLYRDALAQTTGAGDLVVLRERAADVHALASQPRARARLRGALEAVVAADVALASNVNAVTALEKMLMDVRRAERAPS